MRCFLLAMTALFALALSACNSSGGPAPSGDTPGAITDDRQGIVEGDQPADALAGPKAYLNAFFGVTIQYPSSWIVKEYDEGEVIFTGADGEMHASFFLTKVAFDTFLQGMPEKKAALSPASAEGFDHALFGSTDNGGQKRIALYAARDIDDSGTLMVILDGSLSTSWSPETMISCDRTVPLSVTPDIEPAL